MNKRTERERCIDGQMDKRTNGHTKVQIEQLSDRETDGRTGGRQTEGQKENVSDG